MNQARYRPISDYGVIGNLRTVALVARDGSIDWCCIPNFDSPSVFGALLDTKRGGCFRIYPLIDGVQKQMYLPNTNVLLSRFLCPDGVGEITDFMPIDQKQAADESAGETTEIVRKVKALRGAVRFHLHCRPAFDYAAGTHNLHLTEQGAVFSFGDHELGLSTDLELTPDGAGGLDCEFTLEPGETTSFILRYVKSTDNVPATTGNYDVEAALDSVTLFWRRWASGIRYEGRWREVVTRSALALKLLTFQPTGAIVAAPTTSLPEDIGGVRNWDYRYTWIRDAAFSVYALMRVGLTGEAEHFMEWVDARAHERSEDGSLQVAYTVHGGHEMPERELPHLEGYRGSSPVRVGNAAAGQLQLDIYGELMDAAYLANKHGKPISFDLWQELQETLAYVMENWHRKDEGIWEIRSGRHHMVYSKLMSWVALDRGIRLAEKRSFPGPLDKWRQVRDRIYMEIMERGWSEERQSFVQHYDTQAVDASNLIMPLTFFMSPTDPRMQGTLRATFDNLVSDSLVRRYDAPASFDGVAGGEGTFNMCTFWLVEALTRAGSTQEARLIFEKMLTYANHLDLYAEQTSGFGDALGNFPQALTHMGLISAAVNLDRALDRAG